MNKKTSVVTISFESGQVTRLKTQIKNGLLRPGREVKLDDSTWSSSDETKGRRNRREYP
ncbi:MAG: hypothetical protein ACW99V_03635 [Candidatus Thorarchaeota archaeon]